MTDAEIPAPRQAPAHHRERESDVQQQPEDHEPQEQYEGEHFEEQEKEEDALQAYARASDAIVAKSVQRYVGFVRRRKREVDSARWALIKQARGLSVYKERVELRTMKSFVSTTEDEDDETHQPQEPIAGDEQDGVDDEERYRGRARSNSSRMSIGLERRGSYIQTPSTMVSAFCIGKLRGSLDTVMAGLYADTTQDMRANCSIQFGDEALEDCGVLQTFETEDDAHPFRFFGVKWLEKQSHVAGVVDQFCYVERTGIHTIQSGRRFGYQLLKSMRLEPEFSSASMTSRPVNISLCYLYCQIDDDIVEVFVRGIVEIANNAMDANDDQDAALHTAGDYILAAVRGRECGRMRKITALIGRSKTERDQLIACNCSKVIPGLPKVEMCTSCQQAMLRPKLVNVNELLRNKKYNKNEYSSKDSKPSSEPSVAAQANTQQQQMLLKTRYGSLRRDAELPDTIKSYRESQSFRMFLPIRDPRPSSSYRVARKEKGNVLMHMLRRNQHRSTFLPEFLRPPTSDGDGGHHDGH